MNIRTKVICTVGPSCDSFDMIIALIESGMNVARLNFSHGTHKEHLRVINHLKKARERLGASLAIMLDTKGPEIRLGKIKGDYVTLHPGQHWQLLKVFKEGDSESVSITPAHVLDDLKPGIRVLFDDGYISSKVIQVNEEGVVVEIENTGDLSSGKGVNIPNANLKLPALTPQDIEDIRFGCQQGIDIIAASFVRTPEDIVSIKRLLQEENCAGILVIAKIESLEGVQNFDGIVQTADGVMIARGDLGVEIPLSHVPKLQKMMIRKSYLAGKPSVTATQMLESMIKNPRPTRAEASDVANAIYDSTSAVMLSGETAIGKYPLQAISTMKNIVIESELDFNYRGFFDLHARLVYHDVPSAITLATVKTAYSTQAKAIFVFTKGGSTAQLLSRLRPSIPIVAMTPNEKCFHQMALTWGVIPVLSPESKTFTEAFDKISAFALENKIVEYGDLVVVTAGSPFGISGTTNTLIVESIGDVLVRGENGYGHKIHGNVALVLSAEKVKAYTVRGHILTIGQCDESYIPLIEECSAVILQNQINDTASEQFLASTAKMINKPYILRADKALQTLKEGQLVTVDPEKNIVYKGVVL